ncbi:tRNA lysidine(34) synthetase TilS [Piscinibacter sakaiensis]|uniref:tRNA lysidine(34) synthetase TilS n=1 Tax=Piscinibacter sakaiensis TaxID=1547922 RepID=UPI003AAE3A14
MVRAEAPRRRAALQQQPLVAVACSGGRDSTALLHATLRSAAELNLQVIALHVNHGLLPQADEWQRSLRARCSAWARRGAALRLICERIDERPAVGDSIEAWARRVRYVALRRMALAAGCDTVLLAHHRRDQAETFLLQALRGAGVAGIAAMPAAVQRDGIHWLRPWLEQPRSGIDAYVARHRLAHVDDDSNDDLRYARNRLRHQVWPGLLQAFPDAERTLGDAARWAQQATAALQELATIDLATTGAAGELLHRPWLALSTARRSNVLRAWLQQHAGRPAPASLVERLLSEWPTAADEAPAARGGRFWDWGDDRLLDIRGRLRFVAGGAAAGRLAKTTADDVARLMSIDGTGLHRVPGWRGRLRVEAVAGDGVPLRRLAALAVRRRTGGENFQAGPARPARSLKKQFQAADVPAWLRDGPLLYDGDELLFVAGLGLDARCTVAVGDDLVRLDWLPDEAAE